MLEERSRPGTLEDADRLAAREFLAPLSRSAFITG